MSNKEEWGNISVPGVSDEELFTTNWHRKAEMDRVNKNRPPEVHQKKSKTISEQWQDSTYKELRIKILKDVVNTNEWKSAHSAGMEKRKNNGWHEKNSKAGMKRRKPIQTPYGRFESKQEAINGMTAAGEGNANGKLSAWLKTKPTEYYYIEKEQK